MPEKVLAEEVAFHGEHFEEYRREYLGRYLPFRGAELTGVAGLRRVWRTGTRGRRHLVPRAGEPAMPLVDMPNHVVAEWSQPQGRSRIGRRAPRPGWPRGPVVVLQARWRTVGAPRSSEGKR